MTPVPGKPSNPDWIITDSDALLQILLTDQASLIRKLKNEYGIQFVIVEAVEAEVLKLTGDKFKFKDLRGAFDKTISTGIIKVLNEAYLVGTKGASGSSLFAQAEQLGSRLYNYVHRGEAYSHAAAITLGIPILTHDVTAIYKLRDVGVPVPRLTFRVFDILAFGHQTGVLSHAECDRARDTLIEREEFVVECFAKASFAKGLPVFYPRLLDQAHPAIGCPTPVHKLLDERIWINKTA